MTGLWSDLRGLSKSEFETVLDRLEADVNDTIGRAGEKKSAARIATGPKDDRASTRIAFHLTEKLGLGEKDAIRALSVSLKRNGVSAAKLPRDERLDLKEWLEALLDVVPGSVVMDAALKTENK